MASSAAWRISGEERAKHDNQFFQLKPVNGIITGQQAKGFFLQSGLPQQVLGQIWLLSDLNNDGKMDRKEFSIAMCLIQKKLQGFELPKVLPTSLKEDPSPSVGTFGMMGLGQNTSTSFTPGAFSSSSSAAVPGASGITQMLPSGMPAQSGFGAPIGMPPMPGMVSMAMPAGAAKTRAGSFSALPESPSRSRGGSVSGEWSIPHQNKLKYNQLFNQHDRTKRGCLMGVEARSILMQSGLSHPVLAQIWSLSDIDNDGKLTSEEFSVAMYLVDMAKSGQTLPARLPPDLIPPSFRRNRSGSTISNGLVQPQQVPTQPIVQNTLPGMKQDAFNDLGLGVGGGSFPTADGGMVIPEPDIHVSFEDKKRENFTKGQQELERRRQQLLDEQRREQEARRAKEREEQEKRERIRQEQERKKQLEMERHMEKQRQVEMEREEQRRKAMEARETARRQMERQRQLDWERQRTQQLMSEKKREQESIETMRAACSKLKYEMETQSSKKIELGQKITLSRNGVTDYTSSIDQMRQSRDSKLSEIESLQTQFDEFTQKLQHLQQERHQLKVKIQSNTDPVSDTYKTVIHSHGNKKITIEKLRAQLDLLENETEGKLREVDSTNTELNDIKSRLSSIHQENMRLYKEVQGKQHEFKEIIHNKEREKQTKITQEIEAERSRQEKDKKEKEEEIKRKEAEEAKQRQEQSLFGDIQTTQTTTTSNVWGSNLGTANTADAFGAAFSSNDDNLSKSSDIWTDAFSSTTSESNQASWGTFPTQSNQGEIVSSALQAAIPSHEELGKRKGKIKYKAAFQFEARNTDELSMLPGDTVMVWDDQSGAEHGWMGGSKDVGGILNWGWFPEAYVQKSDDDQNIYVNTNATLSTEVSGGSLFDSKTASMFDGEAFKTDFSNTNSAGGDPGFAAFSSTVSQPESSTTNGQMEPTYEVPVSQIHNALNTSEESAFTNTVTPPKEELKKQIELVTASEGLQAQAMYQWRAKKTNHLTFNKGDIIIVKEQQEMWWSGELINGNGKIGWFPKSYVKVIGGTPVISPTSAQPSTQSITAAGSRSETPVSIVLEDTAAASRDTSTSPTPSMTEGELYVAMYNYVSVEPTDLNFNQGDVITVTSTENDWWTGAIGDRSGIFPANYVKKMESQKSLGPKKPEIASVVAQYTASGPEQLSLQPGQLIQVRKKSPSGWWEGELQARGMKRRIGWFPANYVKLLGGPSSNRSTPTQEIRSPTPTPQPAPTQPAPEPVQTPEIPMTPALEQVVAIYAYSAQNEDELTFLKDSVINVVDKDDPDWWKGELNGIEGVFPSNYIQPLSSAQVRATPSPAPDS